MLQQELVRNRCEPPASLMLPCDALYLKLKPGASAADKDAAAIKALGAYGSCAAGKAALIQWVIEWCQK